MPLALTAPNIEDEAALLNFEQIMAILSWLLTGTGVPAATLGVNGAFYFRQDGSSGTYIYQKAAGTWTGIL